MNNKKNKIKKINVARYFKYTYIDSLIALIFISYLLEYYLVFI